MKFGTVINCMDGRVQNQVNDYMIKEYGVEHVDTITLAGPVRVLATNEQASLIENVLFRTNISVKKHGSKVIAVCGHHDCAGIPEPDENQMTYIKESVIKMKNWYPDCEVIGLWLDKDFTVQKIND